MVSSRGFVGCNDVRRTHEESKEADEEATEEI